MLNQVQHDGGMCFKMTNYPVQIALDSRKHAPTAFRWRGRLYRVSAVRECWRLLGAWWDGEGERTFFRVQTDTGGIFELVYDHVHQSWLLDRVED